MIVAMTPSRGIGLDNNIPWKIGEDLKHFKKTTLNQNIVMGRKTRESIGRDLPKRTNWVLRRSGPLSVEHILRMSYRDGIDFWVIGGAEIYKAFLPHAEEIVVSWVPEVPEVDTYFPEFEHLFEPTTWDVRENFSIVTYKKM